MKKMIAVLALMLALIMTAASALPFGLPSRPEDGPVRGENGTELVVENRLLTSRIYTTAEGDIHDIYREWRLSERGESRIARTYTDGEACWFVRLWDGEKTDEPRNNPAAWQLIRLSDGETSLVSEGVFDVEMAVTGLMVHGDIAWITGVGYNGAIFIYKCEPTAFKLEMILPVWWVMGATGARYDGAKTHVSDRYGDHYLIENTGKRTYTDEPVETAAPKLTPGVAGWLLCKQYILMGALLLWLFAALTIVITYLICRRANRLATRLTAVGGEISLLVLITALGFMFYMNLTSVGVVGTSRIVPPSCAFALAVWLLAVLLLSMLSVHMTKLILDLTGQMDDVADGRIAARDVTDGKDELHKMDRSMQEMCMSLAIREYEMKNTIRSYRRFVPDEMTGLLDRALVAEVELGDSRRIEENVGLFAVGNRAEARNSLDDAGYVEFVNRCFGLFDKCVEENRGCMLSSGLRLSRMEAMFPGSPVDGVRAGLDYLGQTRMHSADGIPAPAPFMLLHRISFLYGIAGREERLFPYLYSAELEFLGSFAQRFHEAGVQIVVTEAYWDRLKGSGLVGRYIGFVSDEEKGFVYKLYEVLDAYPELERELRVSYDQRLQEAINLFYRNDFYLARNLFSTLLRACPDDGIVRWYLFASERFFNQEGDAEADYRLFGVDE